MREDLTFELRFHTQPPSSSKSRPSILHKNTAFTSLKYSPYSPTLSGDTHHRTPASACSTCKQRSPDTGMFLKSNYRKKNMCQKELRVQLLKSRSPRHHSDPEPRPRGMNLEGFLHSTQNVPPAQCLFHIFPLENNLVWT